MLLKERYLNRHAMSSKLKNWFIFILLPVCAESVIHTFSDANSQQAESQPVRPPFKQRPFRRTEVRRSETKDKTRGTTHSNEEPSSYSIQPKALKDLPALRAGQRPLFSGGNPGAGSARVRVERGV